MALLRQAMQAGLAVVLLCAAGAAAAQPLVAGEDEVKAAFLYRFGSFVEWPAHAHADATSPFVIAVAGADAIAAHLVTITADRTMGDRQVVVRRIERGDPVGEPHVLFIGRDARRYQAALVEATAALPTLVVSEFEGGIERGSAIDLVVDAERVRFDVSSAAAEAHGLKISSRVLAIARRVDRGR